MPRSEAVATVAASIAVSAAWVDELELFGALDQASGGDSFFFSGSPSPLLAQSWTLGISPPSAKAVLEKAKTARRGFADAAAELKEDCGASGSEYRVSRQERHAVAISGVASLIDGWCKLRCGAPQSGLSPPLAQVL